MAQWIKDILAMQETLEMQIQSLGWEDPLEKEMATLWKPVKIPWTEEPGVLQSMGSHRVDMTEQLNTHMPS